jgi:hypothetical protein
MIVAPARLQVLVRAKFDNVICFYDAAVDFTNNAVSYQQIRSYETFVVEGVDLSSHEERGHRF